MSRCKIASSVPCKLGVIQVAVREKEGSQGEANPGETMTDAW